MFTCHGTRTGLPDPHQHEQVEDAKYCYGLLTKPTPVYTPPAPAFKWGHRRNPDGPLSPAQYNLVGNLKGDQDHAKTLTYAQCHVYINSLIEAKNGKKATVTPYTGEPKPTSTPDPRLKMLEGLLPMVPEGYYAVAPDPERPDNFTFIRYSLPKKNRFAGAWKFQRVIGNASGRPRIEDYAVRWPSTSWSYYGSGYDIARAERCITELMLLVADHQTAAMRYAEHIGRCTRCNAVLTDERSRYYGIGPECEHYRPEHMEKVEAEKGAWRG